MYRQPVPLLKMLSEIFAQTLYKLVQWNFWKHYKLELKQIPIFSEYLLMIWYSDSKIGTRVLVKICDPAHMMYLSSGSNTMKGVEFQWHKFLSGTQ